MRNDPAREEPAEHALDHRPQRAMLPGETGGPDSQQLLDMLLD